MSGGTPATRCDDACRYGAKSPCKFAGAVAGSIACGAEVDCAVEELRASFAAEKTLSREWRAGQLRAFRRMLVDGADELCQAIHADLRKSCFEGFATEVAQVIGEVDEALAHLDEWLRPTYTDSSAMNVPCWSYTQRDPLGLVLILGAWNYPAMLTLGPIVGAIAGGNCVLVKPGSYAPHSSNAIARLIAKCGACPASSASNGSSTTSPLPPPPAPPPRPGTWMASASGWRRATAASPPRSSSRRASPPPASHQPRPPTPPTPLAAL